MYIYQLQKFNKYKLLYYCIFNIMQASDNSTTKTIKLTPLHIHCIPK